MQRLKIDEDIRSLSEFRTGITNFIKQVHKTKRPLVITQNGKGVAVLLDSREFESMQEKIELLTDIHTAVNQLAAGEGIDQDEAKAKVLKSIQK
jgi:prevent-host-death family protein